MKMALWTPRRIEVDDACQALCSDACPFFAYVVSNRPAQPVEIKPGRDPRVPVGIQVCTLGEQPYQLSMERREDGKVACVRCKNCYSNNFWGPALSSELHFDVSPYGPEHALFLRAYRIPDKEEISLLREQRKNNE